MDSMKRTLPSICIKTDVARIRRVRQPAALDDRQDGDIHLDPTTTRPT
ncbi:MAG: hypothetical protein ACXVAW_06175 [Vulcanimicrobiaceae bacterium]